MNLRKITSTIIISTLVHISFASKYFCDPVNGNISNDGLSSSTAWSTLATVISQKNFAAGDTIYLMSGNHGSPYINKSYSEDVVITKLQGEEPMIKHIIFSGAGHWKIDSLTISSEGVRLPYDPPLEHPVYPIKDNSLVQIINSSANITVSNCFIASIENSSEWTIDDWNYRAWNGIYSLDNSDVTIRNCHLKNVNFGIHNSSSVKNNLYEYNVIENFNGDALRGHGTNTIIQYNLVKNAYNTNGNHDDMLQSFSGNPVGLVIRGNTFIAYTDASQPFKSSCQGIGCFDGTFYDFIIENNVVATSHWHGITLLGAVNCRIINNTVVDLDNTDSAKPWIMIDDHKDGTPSSECIIRNNITPTIKKGAGVTSDYNQIVSFSNYYNYFVDFENLDLHLIESAPAVDKGSADQAPDIDLDKVMRPQGDGFDIGAYEFETSTGAERIKLNDNSDYPKLYPNPTSGKLNFEFPELFTGKIIISDIVGNRILEKRLDSQKVSFDLSDKKDGIYFVRIESEINSRYKIIKL